MKRPLVVLAAALSATGCAALSPSQTTAQSDVDVAYVAAVERAAQRYGTQVVWINYPRKRTSASPSQ